MCPNAATDYPRWKSVQMRLLLPGDVIIARSAKVQILKALTPPGRLGSGRDETVSIKQFVAGLRAAFPRWLNQLKRPELAHISPKRTAQMRHVGSNSNLFIIQ